MTVTKTRPEAVDVAATMRAAETSVAHEARQQFAAHLQAYRQAVARMAESEGMLPADEAEQLLAVCRYLGIPPDRLDTDVVVTMRHSRLTAEVDAVMAKAAEQASVVAVLKAELDAESERYRAVRVECDTRVREAERRLDEVQRRHDKAAAVRPERIHEQQAAMVALRNQAPHLWDDTDAEGLRRIVTIGGR